MAPAGAESERKVALVVGGGIGGLAAALALHRAGLGVKVFEQAPELTEVGAGINLLPGGSAVLHDLGMAERLQSTDPDGGAGVLTSQLVYCSPRGARILSEKRGIEAGNSTPQYSIHRGWLHKALLREVQARIGEENVHSGHRFVNFEQGPEGVRADFQTAATEEELKSRSYSGSANYTGDILIGADGLRSKVRAQLLPGERANFTGWRIYRGVLEVDAHMVDGRTMLLAGDSTCSCVMYPICERRRQAGKTLLNWAVNCNDSILAPELRGEPGKESWNRKVSKSEFRHIVKDWVLPPGSFEDPTQSLVRFVDETDDDKVTCYALFDRDPVQQWTFGRVTLLGDAAHPLLPFGSQGAGQAMLDVAALSTAFAECGHDIEAALKAYEKARAEPAAKVVLSNRNMGPTRLLRMLEEAAGDLDLAGQEEWIAAHAKEIEEFSNNYQSMSGLFSHSGATAAPTAESAPEDTAPAA
mmetsp:Transcript_35979/g.102758  ORF Transcript_35979/g.102758 Transcript_35979/m.102758 type:complete len:471 (+) Transcript_35979:48-1460(+)